MCCFLCFGAFFVQSELWHENNLLAPTRRGSSPVDHACITDQGSATVYVVIDHFTGKFLAARRSWESIHFACVSRRFKSPWNLIESVLCQKSPNKRQGELFVLNDLFEHSRSNCFGSKDSQSLTNLIAQ